MKRSLILMLLLTALLLCACGEEAVPDTTAPQAPSLQMPEPENMSTLPHEDCTMELNFAEELPVGAVVELLTGETVVLSHTVEAATQTVRFSGEELRPDISYSLKVNGVLQQHSGMVSGRPGGMTPPPGEIPDPSQPPISEEPMNTETTGDSNGFTPGGGSSVGFMSPEELPIGEMPPEGFPEPPEGSPEPSEFFSEGAGLPEIPELPDISDLPEMPGGGFQPEKAPGEPNHTEFRLRGGMTAFYGICPAN